MKRFLFVLIFALMAPLSYADDLSGVSERASEFIKNLIPGEGHTEASIDLRKNAKPDFSILGVREISPLDQGTIFTQFSNINLNPIKAKLVIAR